MRAYISLDNDLLVESYNIEPVIIKYEFNDMTRNYIPDLCVNYKDGSSIIVEIKPSSLIDSPKNKAKFDAAEAVFEKFQVWDERDID